MSTIGPLPHLQSPIPQWSAKICLDRRLLYNLLFFSRALLITLMTEAVRTSEESVNFNVTTERYIPENFKRHGKKMICHRNVDITSGFIKVIIMNIPLRLYL
jgi:hypothetical protein